MRDEPLPRAVRDEARAQRHVALEPRARRAVDERGRAPGERRRASPSNGISTRTPFAPRRGRWTRARRAPRALEWRPDHSRRLQRDAAARLGPRMYARSPGASSGVRPAAPRSSPSDAARPSAAPLGRAGGVEGSRRSTGALAWRSIGLIGNGQFAALVAADGDVVWCCLPRFDSEPVFATLLDEERRRAASGSSPRPAAPGRQRYLAQHERPRDDVRGSRRRPSASSTSRRASSSTSARSTRRSSSGSSSRCAGTPRVRVRCEPVLGLVEGSGARRRRARTTCSFEGFAAPLRLTTDVPLSYLAGQPVRAHRPPAPRAHLGRADRGAAPAARRAVPRARRSGTGSAG